MNDEQDPGNTQQTQPKGIDPETGQPYEPVEIPVPSEDDFEKLVRRAVKGKDSAAGSAEE